VWKITHKYLFVSVIIQFLRLLKQNTGENRRGKRADRRSTANNRVFHREFNAVNMQWQYILNFQSTPNWNGNIPINAIVDSMPLETRENMPLWASSFVLHSSQRARRKSGNFIYAKDEKYEKMINVIQHWKNVIMVVVKCNFLVIFTQRTQSLH